MKQKSGVRLDATRCKCEVDHMKKYGSITSMEAFREYGITRLSARIKELREMGYNIVTLMVDGTNRYSETVRYGKYVLKGE